MLCYVYRDMRLALQSLCNKNNAGNYGKQDISPKSPHKATIIDTADIVSYLIIEQNEEKDTSETE